MHSNIYKITFFLFWGNMRLSYSAALMNGVLLFIYCIYYVNKFCFDQ